MNTFKIYSLIIILTLVFIEVLSFSILFLKLVLFDDWTIKTSFISRINLHPYFEKSKDKFNPERNSEFKFSPLNQIENASNSIYAGLKTGEIGQILNSKYDDGIISLMKKPNQIRVVIFGGSSAAGWGASSEENTIAANIENILNDKIPNDNKYEVINFGLASSYSFTNLISFISRVSFLNPDIIITFDGYNDAMNNILPLLKGMSFPIVNWGSYSYELFEQVSGIDLGTKISKNTWWILTYTELLSRRLSRIIFSNNSSIYFLENNDFISKYYENLSTYKFSEMIFKDKNFIDKNIEINLDILAAFSEKNNIKFLAYLQPNRLQFVEKEALTTLCSKTCISCCRGSNDIVKGESMHPDKVYPYPLHHTISYEQFESIMISSFEAYSKSYKKLNSKYLNNKKIQFFDMRELFLGIKDKMYLDSVHYTDEGNRKIALKMSNDIQSILSY